MLRIRIDFYADQDPVFWSDDQQFEKVYSWKKQYFYDQKLQFYLSLGIYKRTTGEAFGP